MSARGWPVVVLAFFVPACSGPEEPQPAPPATAVLADFVNTADDPVLDRSLSYALERALSESSRLHVMSGERVADSLRGMNRSADDPVTADVAWEIAAREGADLLLLGTVESGADGVVITLEAVRAGTGESLAREAARAPDRGAVVDALGRAAFALRRSLGEPEREMADAAVPLTGRTTRSLEALARYAEGRRHADRGRHALAVPHYREALALDPDFGLASAALDAAAQRRRTAEEGVRPPTP